MRIFAITFFLIIGLNFVLFSQVVNIEKKRPGDENKTLLGKIDASFDVNKSISTIYTARTAVLLQYFHLQNTYLFLNDLQFMQVDTVKLLNNGFFHFRYNYNFKKNKWLVAEGFTQIQFNRLQNIQRRFLWGGGFRFNILEKKKYEIYSGLASMYEFELYLDSTYNDKIRLSSYLTLAINPFESLTFKHTTYFQPKVNEFSDFRISSESTLETLIYKNLRLKIQFNYFYDNKPAPMVQKVFYRNLL